jgi:exopolysaccharide biosynthesis protein
MERATFPVAPNPQLTEQPYPSINLVRVNLDDPHISTYSTPTSGLNVNGVTATAFLQATYNQPSQIALEGIVGINANFFQYPTGPRNFVYGLAVSNLATVTWENSNDGSSYYPVLITKTNQAVIGGENQPRNADTWTAVSGNLLLLRNGQLAIPAANSGTKKPQVAARTAIGVSYSPNYLYLLTVDGLESNDLQPPYYGATEFDAAMLLLFAGATDAIGMDGGGSTTMGRIDNHGVVLMNTPYGDDHRPSSERAVGNCFAVIAYA